MKKPILVIKFGTASITNENGELDESIMATIAAQVATIHHEYNIVLVSSGAVAAGRPYLKNYHHQLSERKAAAAIGNTLLLNKYSNILILSGLQLHKAYAKETISRIGTSSFN